MRSLPLDSRTLIEVTRAAAYLLDAECTVADIRSTNDRVDAVNLLTQATARLGAEVALMVSVMQSGTSAQEHHMLVNCDPTWCFEYEALRATNEDPWLDYALSHTEPIRSTDLVGQLGQSPATVDLAARYGFSSAVIVPISAAGAASPRGMLCLGSSRAGYFERDGFVAFKVLARAIAMELHEWWLSRMAGELICQTGLTDADMTLLKLESQGCTTKVIARQLGLSTAQVDYRFGRINGRLGVPNRTVASRLVASLGLL